MSEGWNYVIAAYAASAVLYAGYLAYLKGKMRVAPAPKRGERGRPR